MTRLSFGTALLTRLMIPGSDTAVQLMKSTAPARTGHQAGTSMTTT